MLFYLHMDCVIRDVCPQSRYQGTSMGIFLLYPIRGSLHVLKEEDFLWILLYADDIALTSDDAGTLRDMVSVRIAFRGWG